jgi:hypothetical protein
MVDLMDFWKSIGTVIPLGSAGPTIFAPSTRVPSCKHPAQKIFERRYGRTSRFGRITKISKTAFLCIVYLPMQ